jgi:hypothetical protein
MYGRQNSPKNAQGSGQFIPGTAKYGVTCRRTDPIQASTARPEIHAEAARSSSATTRTLHSPVTTLARIDQHCARGKIPNIKETKDYVKKISGNLAKARESYGRFALAWCRAAESGRNNAR